LRKNILDGGYSGSMPFTGNQEIKICHMKPHRAHAKMGRTGFAVKVTSER
jgi:hypothetical protein